MRFLHTADWHIGLRARGLEGRGQEIRERRFATGREVLEAAARWGADFILHGGDLFDDNAVDQRLVQRASDLLGKAPCPVYIIPGNHDPFVPGSVWGHRALTSLGNVHILTEPSPVSVPGGTLYPCPLLDRTSPSDPTAWIRHEQGEGIAVGLAHGSVEGCPIEEWDHPIPRDAVARTGLDYLALGHWHSCARFADGTGECRMAYPGAHETTKFGEDNAGKVLLVTIDAPGEPPVVVEESTGYYRWKTDTVDIRETGDLEELLSRLDGEKDPGRTLLSLTLTGLLPAEGGPLLERLVQTLESRFFWGELREDDLRASPSDSGWIDALDSPLLRETARRIQSGDGAEAVRARALLELYSMVRGD